LQNDPLSGAKAVDSALKYNPVINRPNKRVRGLWERKSTYYAQVKIRGWTGQVRLHAGTVADAIAARQVLKTEIKSGRFLTPAEPEQKGETEKKRSQWLKVPDFLSRGCLSTDLRKWTKMMAHKSTGSTSVYTNTNARNYAHRFYRVVVP